MTVHDLLTERPQHVLSSTEKVNWLRLARSPRVGPRLFQDLIGRGGDMMLSALNALVEREHRTGSHTVCSLATAERELAAIERLGARLICQCEKDYPALLTTIPDPPPVIVALGNIDLLHRPSIAIVGTRNASLAGLQQARCMATDLGTAGFTIVSGLARGIDGAAHESSLNTGTTAVMAGGIDVIYPREHVDLYQRIADQGVLICECAPGTPTQPRLFPRRNRIISGLSLGVVVIEATQRSGSLITARLAGEQGREVFAVPGSPRDPRAQGCNNLIRDGATLVRCAADVVEILGHGHNVGSVPATRQDKAPVPNFAPPPTQDQRPPQHATPSGRGKTATLKRTEQSDKENVDTVSHLLSSAPMTADDLARCGGLSPQTTSEILLEMELSGQIQRLPGNRVSIT